MNVTATNRPGPPAATEAGGSTAAKNEPAGKTLPVAGNRPPPERAEPPAASIDKAIEQIRAYLDDSKRQLNFERDESSGRTIIKVIDPASGEVIRQFPPEEVLRVAALIDARGFRTLDELA